VLLPLVDGGLLVDPIAHPLIRRSGSKTSWRHFRARKAAVMEPPDTLDTRATV